MTSQITRINIHPPASDEEFERAVTQISRLYFRSDTFKRYGRSGQSQYGIDIRGLRDGEPNDVIVLQIKCRGIGKSEPKDELTKSVRAAVKRGINFKEFIYCTSAARDTALQDEAHAMTLELAASFSGEKRLVQVWDWSELEEMAHDDTRIMAVLSRNPDLISPLSDLEFRKKLLQSSQIELPVNEDASAQEDNSPNQVLIDHIRGYVHTRPSQALRELDGLTDGSRQLTTTERSRIHALRGHANRAIGNNENAFTQFKNAYELTPLREPTIANYAWALAYKSKYADFEALVRRGLDRYPESEIIGLRTVEVLKNDDLLPKALRDTYLVKLAYHNNALDAMSPEQALASARYLNDINPTDFNSRMALADALMNAVISKPEVNAFADMGAGSRAKLQESVGLYESLWKETVEDTDRDVEVSASLTCNYMLALRTQGRAKDAIPIGMAALSRTTDKIAVSERLLLFKLDLGDETIDEFLEMIGDDHLSPEMQLRLSAGAGQWNKVIDLIESDTLIHEDLDAGFLRGLRTVAEVNLLPSSQKEEALEALSSTPSENARELTLWAQLARNLGRFDLAELHLEEAARRAGGVPSEVVRMSIVSEAMAQDHKEIIYKYLADFVDYQRDSDVLRALVRIAAYEYPPRKRSTDVISKLAPFLADQTPYLHWRSIYHQQRGEWKEASKLLTDLSKRRSHLGDWFNLYRCARALSDDSKAESLVRRSDLEDMEASPTELIQTAWMLKRHHQGARALAFGLRAIRDPRGQESSNVTAKFSTLIFHPPAVEIEATPVVAEGAFVRLSKTSSNATLEGVVGANRDFPWARRLDPKDKRISAAMGLQVNNDFTIEGVASQTWRITEILPEPVRIARFYSSEHEHLFENPSIFMIDAPAGDIDPYLRMIRETGAADDALVETIFESAIPLSFVADQHDCSSLRIVGKIRARGKNIPTTTGFSDTKASGERVARFAKNGIVLDELTVFTAAEMELLPQLKERFGTLFLPSLVMIPLKERLELQSMHEGEAMSLDAIDGQLYRDVQSAEEHKNGIQRLKQLIQTVENECDVIEVVFPDPSEMPEALGLLIDIAPTVAGSIQLAKQKNVPLLSDDGHLRAWAAGLEKIEGFWLNSAIAILHEDGVIDKAELVDLSAQLSGRQHRHHWITSELLCSAYDLRDETLGMERFRQLYSELGGATASVNSHCAIIARVCDHILRTDDVHNQAMRACRDLIHQCLHDARGQRLRDWILHLSSVLPSAAGAILQAYYIGHFVSLWDES